MVSPGAVPPSDATVYKGCGRRWSMIFFHQDISATPPLISEGVKKCEIWLNSRHQSSLSRLRFESRQDILNLKWTPWIAMMALCPPQSWYISAIRSTRYTQTSQLRDLDLDLMTFMYEHGPYLFTMYSQTKIYFGGQGFRKLSYYTDIQPPKLLSLRLTGDNFIISAIGQSDTWQIDSNWWINVIFHIVS